ncbi:hypothetical protein NQ152_09575 [Microbacterium sp. zg.B48]|uniref:hypothetical protein n=1 Tax=Microbacterium sp. zg.B48 TaxID=2969408 RepID=UPI00214AFEB9|nr:hypothetical protein [Microbacterium sp. zg.B48]MCR2763756.1 hypothetical protein [Microbacterium sp. zg.B48]
MTAVSAPRVLPRATPFERALLRAASGLDRYVAARVDRRGHPAYRRAAEARSHAVTLRAAAEARGAMGVLPR